MVKGRSIGTPRAISLATVDVLEGKPRELSRAEMVRRSPAAEAEVLKRLGLS